MDYLTIRFIKKVYEVRIKNILAVSIILVCLSGVLTSSGKVDNYIEGSQNKSKLMDYEKRLQKLNAIMIKKGFKLDSYIKNHNFVIYDKLDEKFQSNPEANADRALENLSPEEKIKENEKQYLLYCKLLGLDKKIHEIDSFVKDNINSLIAAEVTYKYPPQITAAVLGIESNFGSYTGNYYAFNVYVSLYCIDYKNKFALAQLEELLKFCQRTGIDIFAVKSSYAGAVGYGQFLPRSLNTWFIGNDISNMKNWIFSISNYLKDHLRKGNIDKSIWHYNHSDFYVRVVKELGEHARKSIEKYQKS